MTTASGSAVRFWGRRLGAAVVDLACAVFGRKTVVRASRFVLHRARLDVPNQLHRNGEVVLQRWVLHHIGQRDLVVFDVGANVGEWTAALLEQASGVDIAHLQIHAFEPSKFTFDRLTTRLATTGVRLNRLALSDCSGERRLHVHHPGAGVNSLHDAEGAGAQLAIETVQLTTVDDYCLAHDIPTIQLVKIDTEGHDVSVIRGALRMLRERRIGVIQFEYNHRWVFSRTYLRDAFRELQPLGYRLGKLTPRGVEFYDGWDHELETFVEGNYVACLPEMVPDLHPITWWKAT